MTGGRWGLKARGKAFPGNLSQTPPRFKSADSVQSISDDKFCRVFKSRYSVFQIKTCAFIDCRQASHLLKAEAHHNQQISLLERTAASGIGSGFTGPEQTVLRARAVSPA